MRVGINARYFIPQRNDHYCRFPKNTNHVRNASSHQNHFAATRRLIERANLRNNATPKRVSGFVLLVGAGVILWHFQDIRHLCIASIRTARIGIVATRAVLDYKSTYSKAYPSAEERLEAISQCHFRAATLTLHALLANGGVFIKLVSISSVTILWPKSFTYTYASLRTLLTSSTRDNIFHRLLYYQLSGKKPFDHAWMPVKSLA
jgi:hypothetical protein